MTAAATCSPVRAVLPREQESARPPEARSVRDSPARSNSAPRTFRFAELNATHGGADLNAPEAISKVDPAYPQDLMHDRVEGTVILYAVIHADGSVGDVKVLEGFDDRLNENARKALEQWRFRPGTKDGVPVDIEAVVRVPFKVPRREF